MGITDFFSDLMSSMSFQEVQAEAPKEDEEKEEEGGDDKKDEDKDEGEEKEGEEKEEGGEEEAEPEAEEEEEEEDDEPVDIKPKLEEECARSHQCIGYKHHFDECVERVTEQHSDPDHKGPKEDCVEEFFHLQHCATACAAPKLFRQLK